LDDFVFGIHPPNNLVGNKFFNVFRNEIFLHFVHRFFCVLFFLERGILYAFIRVYKIE
jgi:hypothetical protein